MKVEELLAEREKELRCLHAVSLLAAEAPAPARAAEGIAEALVGALRHPALSSCRIVLELEGDAIGIGAGTTGADATGAGTTGNADRASVDLCRGNCASPRHLMEAAVATRPKAASPRWTGRVVLASAADEDFLAQERRLLDSVANILTAMLETQVMIADLANKNIALRELVTLAGGLAREADRAGRDAATAGLSLREREIAALVREGRTSKEIGAALGISASTVERHRHNIRKKLGLGPGDPELGAVLGM